MSLDKIFEQAKSIYKQNKIEHEEKMERERELKKQKEENEKLARKNQTLNIDPEKECYSQELLGLIKKFQFTIDSYEKFTNIPQDEYQPTLEVYYCSYGNWEFKIKNVEDYDIPEGIFSLQDVKNKITNETLGHFYCDMGCRNTGKARLDSLLSLITYQTTKEYIQSKYASFIELPELLAQKGIKVDIIDYHFKINEPTGYLKVEDGVFIKFYRAWHDDIKMVVTNNHNWGVNSYNDKYGEIGYYFDYHGREDMDELIKCIRCFIEHKNGRIGYYENGFYYTTEDVKGIFEGIKNYSEVDHDKWNHNHIRLEEREYWDSRGYGVESKEINKYEGLEIFHEQEMTFNDNAQWSIGSMKNTSIIRVEYHNRKNDKCLLTIENYVYPESYEEYDPNEDVLERKKEFLVSKVETYGTFLEIKKIIWDYACEMIKIHEIV